jgi:hypothetical protein
MSSNVLPVMFSKAYARIWYAMFEYTGVGSKRAKMVKNSGDKISEVQ